MNLSAPAYRTAMSTMEYAVRDLERLFRVPRARRRGRRREVPREGTRRRAGAAVNAATMRAYVLTGPGEGSVQEGPVPEATPGEVVVDVERAGVCGTDVEFFTGDMAYLHQGHA